MAVEDNWGRQRSRPELTTNTAYKELPPPPFVMRWDRFEDEFGGGGEEDEGEGPVHAKAEDWQALFSGNNDDNFKLGIAITPVTHP